MKLILLGAPGAGKGTQAAVISRAVGIPVISTGNMLRAAAKAGTQLGRTAEGLMKQGLLVPDDIIIGIVKDRLVESDCRNGYILDGVPRTRAQAEALERNGIMIDRALAIEISDTAIVERLGGRRTCGECSATFHVRDNPPKMESVCDHCGGALMLRPDDLPGTIKKRLRLYHEETAPLKDFYAERGKLVQAKSQEKLEDTTRLVMEALDIKNEAGSVL